MEPLFPRASTSSSAWTQITLHPRSLIICSVCTLRRSTRLQRLLLQVKAEGLGTGGEMLVFVGGNRKLPQSPAARRWVWVSYRMSAHLPCSHAAAAPLGPFQTSWASHVPPSSPIRPSSLDTVGHAPHGGTGYQSWAEPKTSSANPLIL